MGDDNTRRDETSGELLLSSAWDNAKRDAEAISDRARKIFDTNDELRRQLDSERNRRS